LLRVAWIKFTEWVDLPPLVSQAADETLEFQEAKAAASTRTLPSPRGRVILAVVSSGKLLTVVRC